MQLLDITLRESPANLACEEALAQRCESGGPEVLRFWEPHEVFVVAGYANSLSAEVNLEACRAEGVPVFRRVSGGGTVLQMPGCLNYALILKIYEDGPLSTVSGANRFIMGRNAEALGQLLGREVTVRGHTDLAVDDRKISGNAQRRWKNCLLFHGCLLLAADLSLVSCFLRFPSRQPDYRQDRAHEDFVANLGLETEKVKQALAHTWSAVERYAGLPQAEIETLVRNKYSRPEWNDKFV